MRYKEEVQKAIEGLYGLRSNENGSQICAFKQCDEPSFDRLPQKFSCPSHFFCREHLADLTRRIEVLNYAAFAEGLEKNGAELNGRELVVTTSYLEPRCCVPACKGVTHSAGWRFDPFKDGGFCTCSQHEPAIQYMLDQQMGHRVILELMRKKEAKDSSKIKLSQAIWDAYKSLNEDKNYSEPICAILQQKRIPIRPEWLKLWKAKGIPVELFDWTVAYKHPEARKTIQQFFSRVVKTNSRSQKSSSCERE